LSAVTYYFSFAMPNLILLNNALRQTGWRGPELTAANWRPVLGERLGELAWERVVDDVRPLLAPGAAPDLLTRDNMLRALGIPD
jgi:hypothetical protein